MALTQEPGDNGTPEQPRSASPRRWLLPLLVFCLLAVGYLFYSHQAQPQSGTQDKRSAQPPAPVAATAARKADIGVWLTGLGNVTPLNTVTVKSRVDGQLMAVHYREGQAVARGDLLATIDPRPFQVQLTQAEGQMARDREQLNNARIDLARYKQLWQEDSIPKQQYDTQEALVRQLEGSVKVDQGQIDNARLQLTYSRITAPVSGRTGLRQVDPGNIIHASDANGLVVITQVQPISVLFPIPEDNLPQVLARIRAGSHLRVDAYDREQKLKLATGTLLTVDNQIDPATGTVKLKALFPNSGNELFPNQFVNASLLVETRRNVVIVPAVAIQRGPQGTFVYVVKPDRTVALRPVGLGVSQGGDVEVTTGLEPGEQVVVDGAERLREGSRVAVKEANGQRGKGGGGIGRPKSEKANSP